MNKYSLNPAPSLARAHCDTVLTADNKDMITLNEQLKSYGENAMAKVNTDAMKKEIAKVAAKFFAPYREDLIRAVCNGASEEELRAEIAAFNADTKNGTMLVVMATETRTNDNGQLIDTDGNVLDGAICFATIQDSRSVKQAFRVPMIADTAQRNNRIVAYWLQFRETREESFVSARNAKIETLTKKLDAIRAKCAVFTQYGIDLPNTLQNELNEVNEELAKFGIK